MKSVWIALLSFLIQSSAQAATGKLSIELEIEPAGSRVHAKKELQIDSSNEWKSLETGSRTVLLTRTPELAGVAKSLELLVLDRDVPGKILASPTIQLNDSIQTRARLKLENGDWISVKIKKLN